jgi:hypothetical protein
MKVRIPLPTLPVDNSLEVDAPATVLYELAAVSGATSELSPCSSPADRVVEGARLGRTIVGDVAPKQPAPICQLRSERAFDRLQVDKALWGVSRRQRLLERLAP